MRITYHHRTRSTDAQRIHILEMAGAFAQIGHEVEVVSLVSTELKKDDAARDAGEAWWQRMVRKLPFAYDLVQLFYNLIGIPLLFSKVLTNNSDLIYERYALFNFTGVLVARLLGKPIVLEVNSPFAIEQQRDNHIKALSFARWSEKFICNLCTKVIVVSTPLRDIMVQSGVKPAKLIVMPNGVRSSLFRPNIESSTLRNALGLTGKTVIGFVGWFRQWHGLDLLLRAFQGSKLASMGGHLLLIGDGPAMQDLQTLARDLDITPHLTFSGPLPHDTVPSYLDLIDIAVQPAANEYCCPMKILEYMALQKAIIAPRQENILDILHEGEAAFFEKKSCESLGSALSALIQDKSHRSRIASAAHKALEERGLTWVNNAHRVIHSILPECSETAASKLQIS